MWSFKSIYYLGHKVLQRRDTSNGQIVNMWIDFWQPLWIEMAKAFLPLLLDKIVRSCHVLVWLSTAGHTSQQSQHFVFVRLAGTQSPRKHFVKIKLFVLCEYLVQCWIAFTSQININIPSTFPTKIFINLLTKWFQTCLSDCFKANEIPKLS